MSALDERRHRVETLWRELRRSARRELGAAPLRVGPIVLLLAAAAGFALGSRRKRGDR